MHEHVERHVDEGGQDDGQREDVPAELEGAVGVPDERVRGGVPGALPLQAAAAAQEGERAAVPAGGQEQAPQSAAQATGRTLRDHAHVPAATHRSRLENTAKDMR